MGNVTIQGTRNLIIDRIHTNRPNVCPDIINRNRPNIWQMSTWLPSVSKVMWKIYIWTKVWYKYLSNYWKRNICQIFGSNICEQCGVTMLANNSHFLWSISSTFMFSLARRICYLLLQDYLLTDCIIRLVVYPLLLTA